MCSSIERAATDAALNMATTLIEPCARYPYWQGIIARWQALASNANGRSVTGEEAIAARVKVLEQQCKDERIPVTYVAHRQGQPLGCISLVDYPRIGGMPPSYWVANVFVVQSQRRQGLASEMLLAVEAHAEDQGIAELYLYATDQVGYYRNRGWQVVSRKSIRDCQTTIMRKFLCACA